MKMSVIIKNLPSVLTGRQCFLSLVSMNERRIKSTFAVVKKRI